MVLLYFCNRIPLNQPKLFYTYCKLVKVRTLCILCNNCRLFRVRCLTPVWFGVALYTAWVEFPRPDRQTVYIQNRDRSSLVIESIIYDINLPLYGVRVLNSGVSNNIQNTMVIRMGLVQIIVFATKS